MNAPIAEIIAELRDASKCDCPDRGASHRYFIDAPGFYRAGCDRCGAFAWRHSDRTR